MSAIKTKMDSAMDSVSNVETCIQMSAMGALGVLNALGLQTRFEDPATAIGEIARAAPTDLIAVLRRVYAEPVKEPLIARRIAQIKEAKAIAAVSLTPATAARLGPLAQDAGADILVVQTTPLLLRQSGRRSAAFDPAALCKSVRIPVILGNAVTFNTAGIFMAAGAAAVLVGMGPGTTSTSRSVVGVGLPQVTATVDCAAARDQYLKQTGRYVPIITDGGVRRSEDLCKALACGSDAVMVGGLFARAKEAPGMGWHWGMQASHPDLPLGTRVRVDSHGSLREILRGPASVEDGTQNLAGAIVACMTLVGAGTLRELHNADIVIAPHERREGSEPHAQNGMYGGI